MYKKLSAVSAMLAVFVIPAVASAHVIVTPAQAGIGAYQEFTTGVPNEKNTPTVAVKLLIPAGVGVVLPDVKPGWDINVVKNGDTTTEIDWTGGSIPVGQRDSFSFTAQTPAKQTTLDWKAYQTYADGTIVHWDEKPTGSFTDGSTPYSETKVVDDLAATSTSKATTTKSNDTLGLVFGLVAILISIGGILFRKK